MRFFILATFLVLVSSNVKAEEDMSAILLGTEVVGSDELKTQNNPANSPEEKPSAEALKADNILKDMASKLREESFQEKMDKLADSAPLGLKWALSKEEVDALKVKLTPYPDQKYPATFTGSNFPKELPSAENVILSFGEDNRLWRIVIISKIQKDDKDGHEIMKTYDNLVRLLTKKYGEGSETKQGFDAPVPQPQESRRSDEPTPPPPSFAESMMKRQKLIYNQFKKDGIELMLNLGAKNPTDTYYTLSYKFLPIIEEREKQQLDAL